MERHGNVTGTKAYVVDKLHDPLVSKDTAISLNRFKRSPHGRRNFNSRFAGNKDMCKSLKGFDFGHIQTN